jgi:hypothetical protein
MMNNRLECGCERGRDCTKTTMCRVQRELEDSASELDQYRSALESIAKNSCCEPCQEAALVAQKALQWP